jgi:hypothetical protein
VKRRGQRTFLLLRFTHTRTQSANTAPPKTTTECSDWLQDLFWKVARSPPNSMQVSACVYVRRSVAVTAERLLIVELSTNQKGHVMSADISTSTEKRRTLLQGRSKPPSPSSNVCLCSCLPSPLAYLFSKYPFLTFFVLLLWFYFSSFVCRSFRSFFWARVFIVS